MNSKRQELLDALSRAPTTPDAWLEEKNEIIIGYSRLKLAVKMFLTFVSEGEIICKPARKSEWDCLAHIRAAVTPKALE